MSRAIVGVITIELYLPGVHSLKEKRGILKSLLARMTNKLNLAAAEIDHHDAWQSAVIAAAAVGNRADHVQRMLSKVVDWIESNFPDVVVSGETIEII
ncbi:MAG: DUF503 domain-containing protein [Chloroflexota bacterium]